MLIVLRSIGYKLRKHIGKALKLRSDAICTAVKNFNAAAAMLKPPRPPLSIKTVLDHVYLSQFYLLRDSHHDLSQHSWVQPAEREAASAYFKLLRSREEIVRINVEVCQLHTWIEDEEIFLRKHIQRLNTTNPPLAWQLHQQYVRLVATNNVHRQRIAMLEGLIGFTGQKGRGVHKGMSLPSGQEVLTETERCGDTDGLEEDGQDDTLEAAERVLTALCIDD
jgi:hypothetical protein